MTNIRTTASTIVTLFALCAIPSSAGAELRQVPSHHYIILTDLEDDLAQDAARRMDAMYVEYARRLADFPFRQNEPGRVYLFAKRSDYSKFVGSGIVNSGGVFMPGRNTLAAFLEGQGRDALRRTLQHEAFHHYSHNTIGPGLPLWLNEGLAQVFEEAIWTGDRFLLGQAPPRRLRQLRADIDAGRLIPFASLLSTNEKQWHHAMRDREAGTTQYNQAWAMAHFLIYATDGRGEPRFRGRLIDMLTRISRGQGGDAAFRAAFSDNIDGFQQRFTEWARSAQPTRESGHLENQSVLADLLVMLRDDERRKFADVAAFKRYIIDGGFRVQYTKGNLTWTSDDPSAYFRDVSGRAFDRTELYFAARPGAPLDDLVCRAAGLVFRTRFLPAGTKTDYEVIVEGR